MRDLLRAAAVRAYEKHGAGMEAEDALRKEIRTNKELRQEIIAWAVHEILREVVRSLRPEIRNGDGPEKEEPRTFDPSFQEEVVRRSRGYLDWPLMDRTLLGNANRTKLLEEAARYTKLAKGNAVEARFFRAMAGKVKGDEVVKDVLSDAQIRRLRKQVEKG